MTLIVTFLLLVMALVGRVGFIIAFSSAMEGGGLAFATEVGQDDLLSHDILGGDVQ